MRHTLVPALLLSLIFDRFYTVDSAGMLDFSGPDVEVVDLGQALDQPWKLGVSRICRIVTL